MKINKVVLSPFFLWYLCIALIACSSEDDVTRSQTAGTNKSAGSLAFGSVEQEIDQVAKDKVETKKVTSRSQCLSDTPKEIKNLPAYEKEQDSVILAYSKACSKHLAEQALQDMKDKANNKAKKVASAP